MSTDTVNVSYLSKNTFKYSTRGSSYNYSTTSCLHHQSSVPVTLCSRAQGSSKHIISWCCQKKPTL